MAAVSEGPLSRDGVKRHLQDVSGGSDRCAAPSTMRRVLIVTSSYASTMIADMHRARQLAWHLPSLGWNVDILCPDESYQPQSCLDPDGADFFAPDIPVCRVPQRLASLFRALGFGSIGPRAMIPMLYAGQRLLRQRRYDLIYFSTSQSSLFLLGPIWRRRFGIPFILDLHDPVYRDDAEGPQGLKHRMSRALSRRVEASAACAAAGLISVSPRYLEQLRGRYADRNPPWLPDHRQAVIPFAVMPQDLQEAARTMRPQSADGIARITYVGTGGRLMARSFSLLCRALSHLRARRSGLLGRARFELYGTASPLGGDLRSHLADIARDEGVADIVSEDTSRVTYRRSLELLLQAEGALILGVDDAGYMPSKLFTYAYTGKPILASLHRDSPAFDTFQRIPNLGSALWFDSAGEMPIAAAADIIGAFLDDVLARRHADRDADLQAFLASAMARRHADMFAACLT